MNQAIVPKFWYLLEQLIPFDADRMLETAKHTGIIRSKDADSTLPWLHPAILQQRFKLPVTKNGQAVNYSYRLFLGVFPLPLVFDYLKSLPKSGENYFEDLISASKGNSCFASVSIDSNGFLVDDSLVYSTVPWAIQEIAAVFSQSGSLNLDHWLKRYEAHSTRIQEEFSAWVKEKVEVEQPTTVQQLVELFKLIRRDQWQPQKFTCLAYYSVQRSDRKPDDAMQDILNSFYLRDLLAAATALESNRASPPLRQYLSAAPAPQTLVETTRFRQHWLSPQHLPKGRWAANPNHNLSLMQQLAVNLAISKLNDGGLFSVNGPPGTGKTTLLRDLIADLIVQRATALAEFETPKDAFVHHQRYASLRPTITGFEMIVASSNNAAVENVTAELPSLDAIAQEYHQTAFYFRATADRIQEVAQTHRKKGQTTDEGQIEADEAGLEPDSSSGNRSSPWGLIAAVLGNKENCGVFCDGFWYDSDVSIRNPLNQSVSSSDWRLARLKFNRCAEKVVQITQERERY